MTRCKRCNRELTNPNSIAREYGPVCAKKVGIIIVRKTRKGFEKKVKKMSNENISKVLIAWDKEE